MPTITDVADNAKKIKEQIAAQSGVPAKAVNDKNLKEVSKALDGAKVVASQGGDPTKTPVADLKAAAGEENTSGNKDLTNQQKIVMTIAALAPTLVGYAVGGLRGGGIGAKVTSDTIDKMEAERIAKAKQDKESSDKFELKKLDLDSKAEDREQRHLDRQATLAAQSGNNAIVRELQAERLAKIKAEREAKSSVEGRMANLNTGDKARLDSVKMGYEAVSQMANALNNNENTFSVWGDNNFTANRTAFEEALGRMQSGGAISKDEENRFRQMAPTFQDNPEMRQSKLERLQKIMGERMGTLGFTPEEFGLAATAPNIPGRGDTRLKPFGPSEAEANEKPLPGSSRKPLEKMTAAELKKELGG